MSTDDIDDGYYEALWPRSELQQRPLALAPRLGDLNGKRIAQIWDDLFKGDQIFAMLEDGLRERFPDVQFVSWREFGSTHGAKEKEALQALPSRLRDLGVDAVISGMAC